MSKTLAPVQDGSEVEEDVVADERKSLRLYNGKVELFTCWSFKALSYLSFDINEKKAL